jgi:alpha-L-fucosidase
MTEETARVLLVTVVWFLWALSASAWAAEPPKQDPGTPGTPQQPLPTSASEAPAPTPQQLAWQEMEFIAFAHFGVNTFTNREWGDGKEDPKLFDPAALDANQWVAVCRKAGIGMIILTAKHHDGFCLWPSKYTEHSVKNSPWRDGKGDVVKEVSDACRAGGLKFGVYLSPWDRHERTYGDSPAYNQHFVNQLTELLSNYGDITEVWFDGACGEGPNGKKQQYDWPAFHGTVRRLQPKAVMFSDAGPDVRWIGNENGFAGETCWSTYDRSKVRVGGADTKYLNKGDPNGPDWTPGECDVSIRPGWFYHPDQDTKVKSLEKLLDIYYASVGRNGVLLLNIPPDKRGLMHENDAARLAELRAVLDETFRTDLAKGKPATATSQRGKDRGADRAVDGDGKTFWCAGGNGTGPESLEVDLGQPTTFNVVCIQEMVLLGQRVEEFGVEAWDGKSWSEIAKGTTVGHKRLLRLPDVTASKVRLTIVRSRGSPTIREFGLYRSPARSTTPPAR